MISFSVQLSQCITETLIQSYAGQMGGAAYYAADDILSEEALVPVTFGTGARLGFMVSAALALKSRDFEFTGACKSLL